MKAPHGVKAGLAEVFLDVLTPARYGGCTVQILLFSGGKLEQVALALVAGISGL